MDKSIIERKITAAEKLISRDRDELERTVSTIKRCQERKKFLETRIKDTCQYLSDLKNRKAMLAIEDSIGKVDEAKLSLLVAFLKEHGDDIRKEEDEGPEIRTEIE